MKKFCIVVFSLSLFLLLLTHGWGQGRKTNQKNSYWEPPGQYSKMFDPKSLETFTGEVTTVDQLTPGYGMSDRVWLGLKTDKGMILVILGPTWFHKIQNFKIEPKEQLEIKGSMIHGQEEPLFIATKVEKGEQILKLRDDSGYPLWSTPKKSEK